MDLFLSIKRKKKMISIELQNLVAEITVVQQQKQKHTHGFYDIC